MKFSSKFALFCSILHFINITRSQDLVNFTCKVTSSITSSYLHTQDVLIANIASNLQVSMIDEMTKCIGVNTAVLVTDLRVPMTEETLRKAAVVIFVVNSFNKVSFERNEQFLIQ